MPTVFPKTGSSVLGRSFEGGAIPAGCLLDLTGVRFWSSTGGTVSWRFFFPTPTGELLSVLGRASREGLESGSDEHNSGKSE